MAISDQTIREIRDRVDIVQVVGRSVALKQRGRNHIGLCPFHQEKTPSFNVSAERGSYYCFGCHASGDAFDFLQRTEGKTFPEAVRSLAAEAGVVIDEQQETPAEREARQRRARLLEVSAAVQRHYLAQLQAPAGAAARGYLARRGISEEQRGPFGVGFGGHGRELQLEGVSADELVEVGALSRNERGDYHRFSERVTFPIRDGQGQVLGFGGRIFGARDDGRSAKYINSPEGPLFHKSELLYGLYEARPALARGEAAVLVEGYLDVIALERCGVKTAVAPCGTALTRPQVRLLARRAKVAVICFDGDGAGQRASLKALPLLLEQGLEVRWAVLPADQDPDSMAAQKGQALVELVRDAPLALEYLIERVAREHGPSVEGRLKAVAELREPLSALPAGLARELFVERAAQALTIEVGALRRELERRGERQAEPAAAPAQPPAAAPAATAAVAPGKVGQLERQIVRLLLEWPELCEDALVARLPELVRSPAVKLFIARAIERVAVGPRPVAVDTLSAEIEHPMLRTVADEVLAGNRVFDEKGAHDGLRETCDNLWRQRARAEKTRLMQELAQVEGDPAGADEQMALLEQIRDLNAQLLRGCPWLSHDHDDTQRAVSLD